MAEVEITHRKKSGAILGMAAALLLLAGCSLTPEPFTLEEHQTRIDTDLAELYADQEALSAPISLHEAMARAVKYNMDHQLKVMENALSQHQLNAAKMNLLPQLTMNAGYAGRDEFSASNSRSMTTGAESLEVSTSSDRDGYTADLGLSWNVMDFGLSYIRATQYADRLLIAQERRRKVVHNIIQDVRSAYWNAVSAQRLLARIEPLYKRVQHALGNARRITAQRLEDPLQSLNYRRDLLEMLRQLKVLRRELTTAKVQLAALMNLKPGTHYTLVDESGDFSMPTLEVGLKELEHAALLHRPELREEAYQGRISADDVTRAMLGMIPGLDLSYKYNYDSNSYNYVSNWWDWSASINFNLLKVFTTGPANIEMAETQEKVVKTRRLALSMAVMSQVHMAWLRYRQAQEEFATAEELDKVNGAILTETNNAAASDAGNEMDVIRAEMGAVLAELRRDVAYADLKNAAGRIFVSVGANPLPDTVTDHDISTLAQAIKTTTNGWFQGRINPTPPPAEKTTAREGGSLPAAPEPAPVEERAATVTKPVTDSTKVPAAKAETAAPQPAPATVSPAAAEPALPIGKTAAVAPPGYWPAVDKSPKVQQSHALFSRLTGWDHSSLSRPYMEKDE